MRVIRCDLARAEAVSAELWDIHALTTALMSSHGGICFVFRRDVTKYIRNKIRIFHCRICKYEALLCPRHCCRLGLSSRCSLFVCIYIRAWQLQLISCFADTFPVLVANGVTGKQWDNVRVTDNWQDLLPVSLPGLL